VRPQAAATRPIHVPARTDVTARIGQAGGGRSRLAGGLPHPTAGAIRVYTLAALLALLPHLDRLGRLLRGGRPQSVGRRLPTTHHAQVRHPS
jgi:hypothetical protein